MLPNLLVIGAQKCGTTALWHLLAAHPECSVYPDTKEIHFFIDESPWPVGHWHLGVDWYAQLAPAAAVVADVSPGYSSWPVFPGVPERAASVVPDAKIAYVVRDPIQRMVAHWAHFTFRGYDKRPMAEALTDPSTDNFYLVGSRYGTQLARWHERFPADRILAFHQSDVHLGAPQLFGWLGVSTPPPLERHSNPTSAFTRPTRLASALGAFGHRLPRPLRERALRAPELTDQTRRTLRAMLEDDIHEFTELSGVALPGWTS